MTVVTRTHRLAVARAWEGQGPLPNYVQHWADSGEIDRYNTSALSKLESLDRLAQLVADAETEPVHSPGVILVIDWWASLARWCSVHAKDRRIGCNEYATGRWKVWVEWNDDAVETGSGASVEQAVADLCDKLATRHPSSALPKPPEQP